MYKIVGIVQHGVHNTISNFNLEEVQSLSTA